MIQDQGELATKQGKHSPQPGQTFPIWSEKLPKSDVCTYQQQHYIFLGFKESSEL